MKFKIFVSISFLLMACSSFAQRRNRANSDPRYKIALETMDGRTVKGLLLNFQDSGITVFPGSWSEWKNEETHNSQQIEYSQIQAVKLKRKNGLLKGMAMGTGIGLLPALVGALFGPGTGQGGAFVSVVTVPLGFITGTIVGAASQKKYSLHGNFSDFYQMRKRLKKI